MCLIRQGVESILFGNRDERPAAVNIMRLSFFVSSYYDYSANGAPMMHSVAVRGSSLVPHILWFKVTSAGQNVFLNSRYSGHSFCTCSTVYSPRSREHCGVGDRCILRMCLLCRLCSVLNWKIMFDLCGLDCGGHHLLDSSSSLYFFFRIIFLLWQVGMPFHSQVLHNEMVPIAVKSSV